MGWNHRVLVFGPTGDYRRTWGSYGNGAGQFRFRYEDDINYWGYSWDEHDQRYLYNPSYTGQRRINIGITGDPTTGLLYINDMANQRFHACRTDGTLVKTIPIPLPQKNSCRINGLTYAAGALYYLIGTPTSLSTNTMWALYPRAYQIASGAITSWGTDGLWQSSPGDVLYQPSADRILCVLRYVLDYTTPTTDIYSYGVTSRQWAMIWHTTPDAAIDGCALAVDDAPGLPRYYLQHASRGQVRQWNPAAWGSIGALYHSSQIQSPGAVAVDPDTGSIYACGLRNGYHITQYARDGSEVRTFCPTGNDVGQAGQIVGATFFQDELYILDVNTTPPPAPVRILSLVDDRLFGYHHLLLWRAGSVYHQRCTPAGTALSAESLVAAGRDAALSWRGDGWLVALIEQAGGSILQRYSPSQGRAWQNEEA